MHWPCHNFRVLLPTLIILLDKGNVMDGLDFDDDHPLGLVYLLVEAPGIVL
jgi:hypothetical protein